MKALLVTLLFFQSSLSFAQRLTLASTVIEVEKWPETLLIIPVEVKVENNTSSAITAPLRIEPDRSRPATGTLRMTDTEWNAVLIRNDNPDISLAPGKNLTKTVYITLSKPLEMTDSRAFYVNVSLGSTTESIQVNVKRAYDLSYTLEDYLDNDNITLKNITKVESLNNVLTIYGEKDGVFQKRSVSLKKGQVYSISETKFIRNFKHFNFIDAFSLSSVPFKVRPALTVEMNNKDTTFARAAFSGLTNVGLNMELAKFQIDRYFANGKKSSHKLNVGLFFAPAVEELDSLYTKGFIQKNKSKQLFLSAGATISYSFNNIAFVFVPYGRDIATSTIGKKWIYEGRRWWGFGIGISPTIFAAALNK